MSDDHISIPREVLFGGTALCGHGVMASICDQCTIDRLRAALEEANKAADRFEKLWLESYVKLNFNYDPETGKLVRIGGAYMAALGEITATNTNGYLFCNIGQKHYDVHRIVWLITHGRFPKMQIDHINGDRRDNRLANLREATNRENGRNRRLYRNNTSGYKGVRKATPGKWRATIKHLGKTYYLGVFPTAEDAHAAYCAAAKKHFGEFANSGSGSI